jgi:hypothetical protein
MSSQTCCASQPGTTSSLSKCCRPLVGQRSLPERRPELAGRDRTPVVERLSAGSRIADFQHHFCRNHASTARSVIIDVDAGASRHCADGGVRQRSRASNAWRHAGPHAHVSSVRLRRASPQAGAPITPDYVQWRLTPPDLRQRESRWHRAWLCDCRGCLDARVCIPEHRDSGAIPSVRMFAE